MITPQPIDDVDFAYPASVKHLMPSGQEYETYRQNWFHGTTWGFKLFNEWFYSGVKGLAMIPKEGINPELATRHIIAIMRSFEPQHEDKTAACAYLLEHWFESATWEPLPTTTKP